jgi:hypothetical protein
VRNGVPFDVAFDLDETTRAAWCIVFAEMEGNKFDWSSMTFKDPS